MFTYSTLITNVVDGDTFDSMVDLGFNVHIRVRFRLYGINCPEMHGPDRADGAAAKLATMNFVMGKTVKVQCLKFDKYGRSVARVTLPNGRDLTTVLIAEGFGVPYMEDSP
jgi:micrococcal nuclease